MAAGVDPDLLAELHDLLRRHPADERPLQHATARFHLGSVLLAAGALDDAEAAFAHAAALFEARGAQGERAKALNGLGATLRTAGRPALAVRAFGHAAGGFAAARLPLEEGAARFNLGLSLREAGRPGEAASELERACTLLDPERVPAQAAAAAREAGALDLERGETERAEARLSDALRLAEVAGDEEGRAAAANALGLALLSAGRTAPAIDAFGVVASAGPRAVRPAAFAMAKANLAVACERAGAHAHARLAARQALGVAAAPAPVREQAAGVAARLGEDPSALRVVLDEAPDDERRERIIREELRRSADADDGRLSADMHSWVEAHTGSNREPVTVAEGWLGGLLELPPDALERLVHAAIATSLVVTPEARETFRVAVSRAMARFHVPQMLRLQDVFAAAAADVGDASAWR